MEENATAPTTAPSGTSASYALPLSIVIAGVMISGTILYTGGDARPAAGGAALGDQQAPPVLDVSVDELVDDDPAIGDPNAPVTIVEFSDFQCPFCRSFYSTTYQQIKENYVDKGLVRIVYRDFPLDFHAAARVSAMAAECADDQGRFWDYHDKLFDEQAKGGNGTITYGVAELKQWAADIGIDTGTFNACLDSQRHAAEVDADFEAGQRFGVSGTPSFIVNDRRLVGAQPYSTFEAVIEEALN